MQNGTVGSKDFGEITPEIAQIIKRQSGAKNNKSEKIMPPLEIKTAQSRAGKGAVQSSIKTPRAYLGQLSTL